MSDFQNLLDATMKILSINTVEAKSEPGAPFGKGNRECLDFVLNTAKDFGFTVKNLDGYCGYADIGEGGEPFAILGHLDTVPIGDKWTKNPLGEICDGVIYGRGVLDDKAPTIACLYAVNELKKTMTPKRKIRLIFGCNEESGWKCIDHYNKCEKMPKQGFSPDSDFPVIYQEKGIVNFNIEFDLDCNLKIYGGERPNVVPSHCRAKFDGECFETFGKSAHSAHCYEGKNAIVKMFETLSCKFDLAKEIAEAFNSPFGKNFGFEQTDDMDNALTINLGVVRYENDKLTLSVDIRYPASVDENTVKAMIAKKFPTSKITKTHFHLPLYVDKNSDLVQTLLKTYNDYTNSYTEPITIGGGTYARALEEGVAFGPVFPNKPLPIHCPDERLPIDQFELMYNIYKEAIKKLCF